MASDAADAHARLRKTPAIALHLGMRGGVQAQREVIEPLRLLLQSYARMRDLQAPLKRCHAYSAGAQFPAHGGEQPLAGALEHFQARAAIGGDEFCSARRGGGAHVRDEVCDGEIDLVPDAAHDRHRTGVDGAREMLIVKSPQVLQRAHRRARGISTSHSARAEALCSAAISDGTWAAAPCTGVG